MSDYSDREDFEFFVVEWAKTFREYNKTSIQFYQGANAQIPECAQATNLYLKPTNAIKTRDCSQIPHTLNNNQNYNEKDKNL